MARNTDYDLDSELGAIPAHRDHRSEDDWDRIWNTPSARHCLRRAIKPGLAVLVVGIACMVMRAGWRRMSSPQTRIIPSAADIHVRMPPPR